MNASFQTNNTKILFLCTHLAEILDGLFDLDQWNEEYWNKPRFFLDETQKRGIIVHLTLWDWFDLSGDDVYGRFGIHPLNPDNNINWEAGTIENSVAGKYAFF